MATAITYDFLNQDKREAEAIAVTLPALLREGGGRAGTPPEYAQYGEAYIASVITRNTIGMKLYIVVQSAFPTGTTATVNVGGIEVFTDAPVDAKGITVSTSEDLFFETGGDVSITLGGGTGNVTKGQLKVVVDTIPIDTRNGNYSAAPAV